MPRKSEKLWLVKSRADVSKPPSSDARRRPLRRSTKIKCVLVHPSTPRLNALTRCEIRLVENQVRKCRAWYFSCFVWRICLF